MSLERQLEIVETIQRELKGRYSERMREILQNNPDFGKLPPVKRDEVYRHAIVSNAEVERSFSMYKEILSDRRHRLTETSLTRHLSIQFNAELLYES